MQVDRVEVDKDGAVRLIGKRFELTDENMKVLAEAAKKNCPDCYGRGYSGRETVTGMYIKCNCVKTPIEKMFSLEGPSVEEIAEKDIRLHR